MFGVLQAKLALITRAYFNERNFSKVQVLADLYHQLCDADADATVDEQLLFGIE